MAGEMTRKSLVGASGLWVLIGAAVLMGSPVVWGEIASPALQVQQVQPRSLDRSLAGMRKGVLTRAKDGAVWIDGTTYTLAADALIENRTGRSLQVKSLRWDSVEYPVHYWLAESADRQIAQLVIYFPE